MESIAGLKEVIKTNIKHIDKLEKALAYTERLLREEKKKKRFFWQRAA